MKGINFLLNSSDYILNKILFFLNKISVIYIIFNIFAQAVIISYREKLLI